MRVMQRIHLIDDGPQIILQIERRHIREKMGVENLLYPRFGVIFVEPAIGCIVSNPKLIALLLWGA